MRAVIDFDTPTFAAAVMAEGMEESQACWNAVNALDNLLARINNPPYQLYLTGSNNFRNDIYPEYKAYRKKLARPTHLQAVKEFLVKEYNAIISDGCEADDLCGIDQCTSNANGEETLLVHIDKDMDMIPGLHYNPPIVRLGEVVREERKYIVSPTDAIRTFYTQLLVGDSGDGIKGAAGIGKVKAKNIIGDLENEIDLYKAVEPYFSCEEELYQNAVCLWIWREPNGLWKSPKC